MGTEGKYGRVTTEHGSIPEDEPVFLFRARDKALPQLLTRYAALCLGMGARQEHIAGILLQQERIETWQREHPDQVHVPSSERTG